MTTPLTTAEIVERLTGLEAGDVLDEFDAIAICEAASALLALEGERDAAIKDVFRMASAELTAFRSREAAEAELAKVRTALGSLVEAKALADVRGIVAGWNGEGREDGPYETRHPARLGAQLPKTTCGAIYELDEAMQRARAALSEKTV